MATGENENPNAVEVAPGLSVPTAILRFTFAGSGGPGGQNVNKLNTKAVLSVQMADLAPYLADATLRRLRYLAANRISNDDRLVLSSDEARSQKANRQACLRKLRELLLSARHRPKPRKPTRRPRSANEKRLEQKKQRGRIKQFRSGKDLS